MKIASIDAVISALRRSEATPSKPRGKTVFLIGAGCSASAGIPTGYQVAATAIRELVHQYSNGKKLIRLGKEKDGLDWLKAKRKWPKSLDVATAYTYIFQEHYADPVTQQEFISEQIKMGGDQINWAHLCLGELVLRKRVHTVLTTNFDQLVLRGCVLNHILPAVFDGIDSLVGVKSTPMIPQVIHLHGSMYSYRLRNSALDVLDTKNSQLLQSALGSLIRDSENIVVIGYAGGEEGVMDALINAFHIYPNKQLYWISYERSLCGLSQRVVDLVGLSENAYVVLGQDADDFFYEIMEGLNIGVPSWIKNPINILVEKIENIAPIKNINVSSILNGYRLVLSNAQQKWQTRQDPMLRMARISELRAEGRHQDALKIIRRLGKNRDSCLILKQEADSLFQLSRHEHKINLLTSSSKKYQDLFTKLKKHKDPLMWAKAKNDYAIVLKHLADRRGGELILRKKAIRLFEAAISVYADKKFIQEQSTVENNLAALCRIIGDQTGSAFWIKKAIEIYRKSIRRVSQEAFPYEWGLGNHNLGVAMTSLAEAEHSLAASRKASLAFKSAIEVRPRDTETFLWASTMNGMGIAHYTTGKLLSYKSRNKRRAIVELEKSVDCYKAALEVRVKKHTPKEWGVSQNNLGDAFIYLGELKQDSKILHEAIITLRDSLSVRKKKDSPILWGISMSNEGRAYVALGKIEGKVSSIKKGILLLKQAQDVMKANKMHGYALTIGSKIKMAKEDVKGN